jgi:hypothetical protein
VYVHAYLRGPYEYIHTTGGLLHRAADHDSQALVAVHAAAEEREQRVERLEPVRPRAPPPPSRIIEAP